MTDIADATPRSRSSRRSRTVVLLVAGVVVATLASTVVALIARAVGAPDFAPLQPLVFAPFVIVGFAAAAAGWAIIRARAPRPAAVLRVLVPVLTVLSLAPDVVLAVTRFIPGTTLTGALALMLMHLIVVGVAVPVLIRALPVTSRA